MAVVPRIVPVTVEVMLRTESMSGSSPGDSTDLHAAGEFTIKFTGIDNVYIRSRSHSSFEIYRGGGK